MKHRNREVERKAEKGWLSIYRALLILLTASFSVGGSGRSSPVSSLDINPKNPSLIPNQTETFQANGSTNSTSMLNASAELIFQAGTLNAQDPSGDLNFTLLNPGSVTPTQNPLVAKYSITLLRDAQVSVEFGLDTNYGLNTWTQSTPAGGGAVNIFVAGMRASTTYHMRGNVTFTDGTSYHDPDMSFTTGPLPSNIPTFTVTNSGDLSPFPGVVLFSLINAALPSYPLQAVATDLSGNIIWYYEFNSYSGEVKPLPIKLLPNGNMLLIQACGDGIEPCSTSATNLIEEIDLAGDVIWQLTSTQLQHDLTAAGYNITVDQFTHDAQMLPNGHYILVVSDQRSFTGLAGTTGTTIVYGTALIDLDHNHKPVWVWDAFDHLDVNRQGFDFPDWIHGNAVRYSPDDGNLILSARNQSWLIKIDYEDGTGTGDIIWKLGYQGDFILTNGGEANWFYGQHYPIILSPNSTGSFLIGMFDNGNSRVMNSSGATCGSSGEPACYSTVPIYEVDEAKRTASLQWDYVLPLYSSSLGTMQVLPNSDVWFSVGIANPSDKQAGGFAREVTQDTAKQMVLQINSNELIYRAVHMPSLYPGVQ